MNQASHFLDGSMIYGPTSSVANSLRSFEGGLLTVSEKDTEELLPASKDRANYCHTEPSEGPCYMSGNKHYINNY